MNRLILSALVIIMCSLVSCKSHKATVIRPGAPTAAKTSSKTQTQKKVTVVPKNAASKPEYNNDKKVSDALVRQARGWIGTPYRYGGDTKKGTDCSGLVKSLFYDVAQLSLPRNSAEQCEYCFEVPKKNLQPGDLVFFTSSTRGGKVTHVGLYIGNGKMIHASTSKGVIESGLDEKYYQSHYHSSGRVYGITYASRGKKGKKSQDQQDVDLARAGVADAPKSKSQSSVKADKKKTPESKSNKAKNNDRGKRVEEIKLDDYVEMSKVKPMVDTVLIEERVIEETVEALDSASTTVDSINATIKKPASQPKQVEQKSHEPKTSDQTASGLKMKVNGKVVEATPAERKPEQKRDSVPADSVRRAEEIRENVVKAMKFGK